MVEGTTLPFSRRCEASVLYMYNYYTMPRYRVQTWVKNWQINIGYYTGSVRLDIFRSLRDVFCQIYKDESIIKTSQINQGKNEFSNIYSVGFNCRLTAC